MDKLISNSPEVTLIAATEWSYKTAAALLIFTKNTRLKMTSGGLIETQKKVSEDPTWALSELDYMSKTIRSSWEFLDFTFMIQNISRATAQQITRTRLASFAMSSQRVTSMADATISLPEDDWTHNETIIKAYHDAMEYYEDLIKAGAKMEDARGVLPLSIQCNLVMKVNMRTLVDILHSRTSARAQGEYRTVAQQMSSIVHEMYPWFHLFMRSPHEIADSLLVELESALGKDEVDLHAVKMLAAKARDTLNK